MSEGIYDEGFGRRRTAAARRPRRRWRRSSARGPEDLPRSHRPLAAAAPACRFSSVEGDLQFYVDPVPRVITAADWEPVKRGLAQRVRALNAFVADVYGEQRIVAEGVVPRRR